ncbi:MAG: hypothetical protein CMM56_07375 [Rhodospirillaceae bacterium]|nr:hypothetical protein [Rhodospirillaceae bacterium]|tara:strand:+ start:768 stop:953 length:186 start_codon:yes stop_codon:yes gene_type:complete
MGSSTSKEKLESDVTQNAEETFSSEKREDLWAIIIALGIFVCSLLFPDQVFNFFRDVLYFF